jgi:gamma-tubulin complex component 3
MELDIVNELTKPNKDPGLIKDILLALQGVDGNTVAFSQGEGGYIVQPQLQVSESIRLVVKELCEVGWLYRQVSAYVAKYSEDSSAGLVQQGFCSALQQELSEYYRLLAQLEQRQHEFTGTAHLLKLKLWTYEPLQRMKWLSILVEAAGSLKGGALISSVYSFSLNGSAEVSELVGRVLQEVTKPVFEMIKTWMTKGEVYDPFHEFFIKAHISPLGQRLQSEGDIFKGRETVTDEQLWTGGYTLQEDMVPAFLTAPLVAQIMLTGKSLSFLKRCCGVHELLDFGELREIAELKAWVEGAAVVANTRLVRVMIDQYRFLDHCEALRKYLLMGQGDFHHYLIESLWEELGQSASEIYRHNLVGLLEGAIRATTAKYDDSEFVNRIDVRLLEPSPGEVGWDVFTLEYKMDPPLSTVFTASVLEQYLRLHKFFWKLKRVEYFLTTKTYRHTAYYNELNQIHEIRIPLHRCQLVRHKIAHFVSNLVGYLMVEVIESGWSEFVESTAKLADMDQLIEAHSAFLNRLVNRAFLSQNFDPIYQKLLHLLDLALRFVYSQEALHLSAEEELDRLKGRRTQAHVLDVLEMEEEYSGDYESQVSQEAIRDIDQVSQHFLEGLQSFRMLLEKHDQGRLKSLSSGLDFNEFYAKMLH